MSNGIPKLTKDQVGRLNEPDWWIKKCTTDLYFLNRCIMQTLEDPTPGYKDLYRPTHKRICDFVQNYAYDGQKLLILTPRSWIKSYLVTVGWSVQRLLKNFLAGTREHSLISNATISNAEIFLEKIKNNLQYNDILTGLFREFLPLEPEKTAPKWTLSEVQLEGNRIETGSVEGNLVSRHYKIMIHDDLVNKDNSMTSGQLLKTIDWWRLAQSLLLPSGIEIIIGTRWDYDDLYGALIEKYIKPEKNYALGKPIVELHSGHYHLLQMDCWSNPEEETGSTFPVLFPEEKLKELQIALGDRFPGQYRNDPSAKGKNIFQREWISRWKLYDLPEVRVTRMLFDPSGKADADSDYTGFVVIHFGSDKIGYIERGERYMITDKALAEFIISEAPKYNPDTIEIEENKFAVIRDLLEILVPQKLRMGKVPEEYIEIVKNLPYILIELKPRQRNKIYRIKHLSGWIESGRFKFPYNNAEDLIKEIVRFPSTKYDDIVDALAYCLDNIYFPAKTDTPKALVLSKSEKMTDVEREKEEWDNIEELVSRDAYRGFEEEDLF